MKSQSKATFETAILDAEQLLAHFNKLNTHPPASEVEVLKRAGLIMAFTAWETYVEDRVREAMTARISGETEGVSARFIQRRLDEELKRFNSPNSEKTRKLFLDFLEIDVTKSWAWNQYDTAKVKEKLDTLIAKRGEAVHRSSTKRPGPPEPHLITKDELKKAISFLRALVDATEKAL